LRARYRLKLRVNTIAGVLAVAMLKLIRRADPDRAANFAGRVAQKIGPWVREHRIARANLVAAFPEKSPSEIERILRGSWDNLGRVAAEYAHLGRMWSFDPDHPDRSRIESAPGGIERFEALREDGKPALIFAAHLANWELPAVAAATYQLDSAIIYRPPNIGDVAEAINRIRAVNMGTLIPTGPDAIVKAVAALERGAHVAMLVDQHHDRGIDVNFLGRTCKASPVLARLARHFDCPIHGTRSIRLPDHRFRLELTPAIEPARTPSGEVDVAATTQIIASIIEGWVREHPEQWLWQHRRWR
jgi:KDO2-lipid IV(A) lauroyltransferase